MTLRGFVLPADAAREDWLRARRAGITATDMVKIVGLSKFGTALDVYLAKRLGEDDPAMSEEAAWGMRLEDEVAREWAARAGVRVRRVGLMCNRSHPTHLASVDRMVVGRRELLEVKTRTGWAADEWDDGAVPERVTIQVQWQMHVTGTDVAHIAVLLGGQRLISAHVDYDPVLVDYLKREVDRVWAAVQAGEPPDVELASAAALDRLHPHRTGQVEVAAAVAGPLLTAYRAAAAEEKRAGQLKDDAKAKLIALLGDGEEGLVDGRAAFSYRRGRPQVSIPAEKVRALVEAHPDIAAEFVVEKPGRSTFTVRKDTIA